MKSQPKLNVKSSEEISIGRTEVFTWFGRFKNCSKMVNNNERSRRSSSSTLPENIVKVKESICGNRRKIIHDAQVEESICAGTSN